MVVPDGGVSDGWADEAYYELTQASVMRGGGSDYGRYYGYRRRG